MTDTQKLIAEAKLAAATIEAEARIPVAASTVYGRLFRALAAALREAEGRTADACGALDTMKRLHKMEVAARIEAQRERDEWKAKFETEHEIAASGHAAFALLYQGIDAVVAGDHIPNAGDARALHAIGNVKRIADQRDAWKLRAQERIGKEQLRLACQAQRAAAVSDLKVARSERDAAVARAEKAEAEYGVGYVVKWDHEVNRWVSGCPVLDVWSSGDTAWEAIERAIEAVSLFTETLNSMNAPPAATASEEERAAPGSCNHCEPYAHRDDMVLPPNACACRCHEEES